MNKLLTAAVIAASLLASSAAFAGELPDYSDKTEWSCGNKTMITSEMAEMVEQSAAGTAYGLRLLYIKGDPIETSRKPNELRCRITAVTNRGSPSQGIFRFHNQDGHALVGYEPGRSK